MIERLKAGLVIAAAAALLIPLAPQAVEAQGRFRVIIPDVVPADNSDPHFGNRVSGYLRDMIDLDTHVAMPRGEIDERAREFDLRYNDLDCNLARQLATQIDGQIVMCGTYEDAGGGEYRVDVTFYTIPALDEFDIAPFTRGHEEWVDAAQHLSNEFSGLVDQLRTLRNCDQALRNSSWNQALEACEQSLEFQPNSIPVRRGLARAHRETEQWDASLVHYEAVLQERPSDSEILQNAGWVAAQAGETDKAREYYSRYLEQNPGDVEVRIRVAYDLDQAGDPYGAMTLLEEGFELEPDNVDLHDRFGNYSFRAALALQEEQQTQQQDGDRALSPEVEELFRQAIASFEVVLEEMGSEGRPAQATNTMRAYRQLGEPERAVEVGRRAAQWFPDVASVHSQLASAHNDAGNVDEAIAALDRALELDPELSQGRMRRGVYLLEAGRVDEAVASLREAAEFGEQQPDQLANIVFGHGYSEYVQQGDHREGIRIIEAAKEFDVSPQTREQIDFFHGYALLQLAEGLQEPGTLESARQTLPMFREARQLVEAGRGHLDRTGQSFDEIANYIDQYITIQEAIIQREGGRR